SVARRGPWRSRDERRGLSVERVGRRVEAEGRHRDAGEVRQPVLRGPVGGDLSTARQGQRNLHRRTHEGWAVGESGARRSLPPGGPEANGLPGRRLRRLARRLLGGGELLVAGGAVIIAKRRRN